MVNIDLSNRKYYTDNLFSKLSEKRSKNRRPIWFTLFRSTDNPSNYKKFGWVNRNRSCYVTKRKEIVVLSWLIGSFYFDSENIIIESRWKLTWIEWRFIWSKSEYTIDKSRVNRVVPEKRARNQIDRKRFRKYVWQVISKFNFKKFSNS